MICDSCGREVIPLSDEDTPGKCDNPGGDECVELFSARVTASIARNRIAMARPRFWIKLSQVSPAGSQGFATEQANVTTFQRADFDTRAEAEDVARLYPGATVEEKTELEP